MCSGRSTEVAPGSCRDHGPPVGRLCESGGHAAHRLRIVSKVLTSLPIGERVGIAFSGGLDTSIILKWLEETYGCEIVTFTAYLGQGEELTPARAKARQQYVLRRMRELDHNSRLNWIDCGSR